VPQLTTAIAGLRMTTPLMLASGTVGYGHEYEGLIDFSAVGAIVTKTITPAPRTGNAPPRLCETAGGLLNSIGLENVGLSAFLESELPRAAGLGAPVIASVAGDRDGAFADLTAAVAERDETSAVELNVSCPNVERRSTPLWADPDRVTAIVGASRSKTPKPLLVKLSPNVTDAVPVALAAQEAGADALVVANTMPAMRIDTSLRAPALGNVTGGLSGAALLPINLALVWKLAGAVSIPIVGSGGVRAVDDALEYLLAGAVAVQAGTVLFSDPDAPRRIVEGLLQRMEEEGVVNVTEYVGRAREYAK